MFLFCENTRWSALPVAGGLYDQHPILLREWEIIFRLKAELQEEREREQKAKGKTRRRGRG